ncbi:MAG: EAL domain-containing protein [Treponema sp.]|nr:EAL domain-containing protein [Treponema sp.]
MQQLEKQVIFTNAKCIGCNRCIASCPVPGANIAAHQNGKRYVLVDNTRCIHCGHCLEGCPQSAREYVDDTKRFFADLQEGHAISAIVSPVLWLQYPEKVSQILGYLQSLGVKKFFDAAAGSDIVTWAHANYLQQHSGSIISSTCSALVNYVEKVQPELIPNLVPIHTPSVCLAIYLKKYRNIQDRLVYLSPCIADYDQITSPETQDAISYHVTIKELMKVIGDQDISSYSGKLNLLAIGPRGRLYFPGGLKENLDHFLGTKDMRLQVTGINSLGDGEGSFIQLFQENQDGVFVDFLDCKHGCLLGTGTNSQERHIKDILREYKLQARMAPSMSREDNPYNGNLPEKRRLQLLQKRFSSLSPEDFQRRFNSLRIPEKQITSEEVEEVFHKLYKTTEKSRNINCQDCGYKTCTHMAEAVARGYSTIHSCTQYQQDMMIKMATTDIISGLPNKAMLFKAGEQLFQSKAFAKYVYVLLDINHFGSFNNRFGYEGANRILMDFSQAARRYLEPEEKLFHIEADKFVAILNKPHLKYYTFLINNLMLTTLTEDTKFPLKLTVRSRAYDPDGTEESFSEIAKHLLSTSSIKNTGFSNETVIYNKSNIDSAFSQVMYIQHIPQALANKEFEIVYQPKVGVHDHKLKGAEALVRWRKDDKFIPPSIFIPICESAGLIQQLDFYILNQVCNTMDSWIQQGLEPVKVSVNFSMQNFTMPDIGKRICNIVDNWQLPHNLIEIEFTETAYNEDEKMLSKAIRVLNDKGFSASIDDFGSGYSSLSLLENLKFDVLKLDKSLIDTILQNPQSKIVVTNIVRMAKELNMEIVAEGVETRETLQVLKELDCDLIQGYYFDKPLFQEEFEQRLKNKHYPL